MWEVVQSRSSGESYFRHKLDGRTTWEISETDLPIRAQPEPDATAEQRLTRKAVRVNAATTIQRMWRGYWLRKCYGNGIAELQQDARKVQALWRGAQVRKGLQAAMQKNRGRRQWEAVQSRSTGETYFRNKVDGTTTWERAETDLPPLVSEADLENSPRTRARRAAAAATIQRVWRGYWLRKCFQEGMEEVMRPIAKIQARWRGIRLRNAVRQALGSRTIVAQSEAWEAVQSRSTGEIYFHNKVDGRKTWDRTETDLPQELVNQGTIPIQAAVVIQRMWRSYWLRKCLAEGVEELQGQILRTQEVRKAQEAHELPMSPPPSTQQRLSPGEASPHLPSILEMSDRVRKKAGAYSQPEGNTSSDNQSGVSKSTETDAEAEALAPITPRQLDLDGAEPESASPQAERESPALPALEAMLQRKDNYLMKKPARSTIDSESEDEELQTLHQPRSQPQPEPQWEAVQSRSTGEMYYRNMFDGTTTWERSETDLPQLESEETATLGIPVVVPDTQRAVSACDSYQLDMTAKEFGICKCGFAEEEHEPQPKPKGEPAVSATDSSSDGEDPVSFLLTRRGKWEVQQSRSTGDVYYVNAAEGTTTWERSETDLPAHLSDAELLSLQQEFAPKAPSPLGGLYMGAEHQQAARQIQAQWRGSAAAGTGRRPVPEPEPEPEGNGEHRLEPVPVPERSPAAGRFQVGDKVQRRDGNEAWGIGHVTQLEPLKVNMSATDPAEAGYKWDEVRPSPREREPEDIDSQPELASGRKPAVDPVEAVPPTPTADPLPEAPTPPSRRQQPSAEDAAGRSLVSLSAAKHGQPRAEAASLVQAAWRGFATRRRFVRELQQELQHDMAALDQEIRLATDQSQQTLTMSTVERARLPSEYDEDLRRRQEEALRAQAVAREAAEDPGAEREEQPEPGPRETAHLVVPEGASAGDTVTATTASGGTVEVPVPSGASPGRVFTAEL